MILLEYLRNEHIVIGLRQSFGKSQMKIAQPFSRSARRAGCHGL
jgi:hypothetical protein